MKRLILLAVLSTAAAFAASRAETTTYVDGNLTGVSPNTGGTLLLSEEKAMYFRTGLSNVVVPYEGISKVELGAVKETSHGVPLYKVWALHKRFAGGNKTETQLLIVGFKNEDGEEKSMTLELAQSAASSVVSTLQERTGKTFVAATNKAPATQAKADASKSGAKSDGSKADAWWGDDYWKTTRNADKWNKSAGSNNNNNNNNNNNQQ
jgi:hypothetical protein